MTAADVDLFEINEAFCSVVLSTIDLLGVDPDRINVQGGAVAFGHPIGASGARLVGTLMHQLRRRGGGIGVAAICSRRGPGRRDGDRGAAGMSEIRRITVVGAGQMGAGIAQMAAVGGFDVTLVDVAPRQLEQAVSGIEASLTKLTDEGPPGRGDARRRGRADPARRPSRPTPTC